MNKKTIWFMHGYANLYHAIADIKQADEKGEFRILCTHLNHSFVGFESADFFEVEPKTNDAGFIEFCVKMIKKYGVDVIFASNRQTLLNKNRKMFEELGVELVTAAPRGMINTINNKGKLYDLLKGNDVVKIPEFSVFSNVKEFSSAYRKMSEKHDKLCMKPVRGVYGVGFYVLKEKTRHLSNVLSQSQVLSVSAFKKMATKKRFSKMMLMQFLEGKERSVDCVAVNGFLIGGVIRKKIAGNLPQVIEKNDEIMKQVEWLTKKLKLNGMFNVQFRDSGGEHYLLEINPRLSGRSFYATVAGLNLPYVASLVFSGLVKKENFKFDIKYGTLIAAVTKAVVVNKTDFIVEESDFEGESK